MAALAIVAFFLFFGSVFVVGFLCWVSIQYQTAKKYRRLLALHALLPKELLEGSTKGGFTLKFKEGRKIQTVQVGGRTEKEAMGNVLKMYPQAMGSIISLEANT